MTITDESVRLEELKVIVHVAAGTREGTLVLCGEHGSGKTHLLTRALERFPVPAHLVRANRSEAGWAFAGLSAVLATLDQPRLDDYFDELLKTPSHRVDAFVIATDLVTLLRSLNLRRRVLLVDDIDDFDAASRQTLAFLARRLLGTGVSLIFATSSPAAEDEFVGLPSLALSRLDRSDSLRLARSLAAHADPAALEYICNCARGRLDALVDQARDLDRRQLTGASPLALPLRAADRLASRLSHVVNALEPRHRDLLERLATGAITPIPSLVTERARVLDDLNDLEAAGLVTGDDSFVRIADAHIRSLLYWSGDSRARRERHADAAALVAGYDPRLSLWHISFVDPARASAGALLGAARSLVEAGQLEAGTEFAERALGLEPAVRQGKLLLELARAFLEQGEVAFASRYARTGSRDGVGADGRLELAELRLQLDFASSRAVSAEDAFAVGSAHVRGNAREAAELLSRAALLHAERWECDDAHRLLAKAQASGPSANDTAEQLRRFVVLVADAAEGRPRQALTLQRELSQQNLGDDSMPRVLLLGNALSLAERYDEARSMFAAALRTELRPLWAALAALYRIDNEIRAGAMAVALPAIEELKASDPFPSLFRPHKLTLLHWFWNTLDDPARAAQVLAEYDSLVEPSTPSFAARLKAQCGEFALLRGDLRAAVTHLSQLEPAARRFGNPALLRHEGNLIEALARSGHPAAATSAYRNLQRRADRYPSRWATLALARSKAFITAGEASVTAFRQALSLSSNDDSRYERARTLLGLAEHLDELGQRRESHEMFLAAGSLFTGLGARAWARRAGGAAIGVRRRDAIHRGEQKILRVLTADERAVVERVMLGKRNREIAQELFVSVRTVEIRLTRTYRKLGVRSRAHLASLFAPVLSSVEEANG